MDLEQLLFSASIWLPGHCDNTGAYILLPAETVCSQAALRMQPETTAC